MTVIREPAVAGSFYPGNAQELGRTVEFLLDIGLVVPTMDSARGAEAFMAKGCIVCHAVNGVGGEIGPSFDAAEMPQP